MISDKEALDLLQEKIGIIAHGLITELEDIYFVSFDYDMYTINKIDGNINEIDFYEYMQLRFPDDVKSRSIAEGRLA